MSTTSVAQELAAWATSLRPSEDDLELAARSLRDTIAVALAAREHPLQDALGPLGEAGRWSALAHVLDFDDLHLASTTHISAVCVPAALAAGGDARSYLAGAGVMARLGTALGWGHYTAGWHATCTAGAPGAAVASGLALGLDAPGVAAALALAVPAAGGVQTAFGSAAKSLQVAFAAEAGLRAARLAAAGAGADPRALEDWMSLVGGDPGAVDVAPGGEAEAVPGGLAIKLFPCCYALQRPISALLSLGPRPGAGEVRRVCVRTPASSLAPLRHHEPQTGLEGKFSLEYGLAAALLDGRPGVESFSDQAVARPQARRLMGLVGVQALEGGEGLLAGEVEIELELDGGGAPLRAALAAPPEDELEAKLRACVGEEADELLALDWAAAADYLRAHL